MGLQHGRGRALDRPALEELLETLEVASLCAHGGGLPAPIRSLIAHWPDELELEPELAGNAYTSDKPRVPGTMGAARERFHSSEVARAALGDDVVDHYANMADIELAAYNAAVTDWELVRGFERL